jgi:hypothetical protein
VTARRADTNDNALRTLLMSLIGVDRLQVSATSIMATLGDLPAECSGSGLFSRSRVMSGSNNRYLNNYCLFGHRGVEIGSDTFFQVGTIIQMPRLSDFRQSGNNSGVVAALREAPRNLQLPDQVVPIMTAMRTGDLSVAGLPSFITRVERRNSISPSTVLIRNTLYIIRDVADLGSDRNVSDIAIVAGIEIKTGSNVTLNNVILATNGKITFGSNLSFGTRDFCERGAYSVYAFAVDNIEFGSSSLIRGMQMASRNMIKLGSQLRAADGVYGEAISNIEYGSADSMAGCPTGLTSEVSLSVLPGRPGPIALVQ